MTSKTWLGLALLALSGFAVGQGLPPYNPQYPIPYNNAPAQAQYPAQTQYPAPSQYPPQAQYPAPAPYPQAGQTSGQVSPQMLGEMLRCAATFHELIRSMNLATALGPDQHAVGPDGRPIHPVQRTAQVMGAGAGVGAAIGEMTHKENGVMIGALVGGIGGLIVDQVMKQREEARYRAYYGAGPDHDRDGRDFRDRDHDGDRRQFQPR